MVMLIGLVLTSKNLTVRKVFTSILATKNSDGFESLLFMLPCVVSVIGRI